LRGVSWSLVAAAEHQKHGFYSKRREKRLKMAMAGGRCRKKPPLKAYFAKIVVFFEKSSKNSKNRGFDPPRPPQKGGGTPPQGIFGRKTRISIGFSHLNSGFPGGTPGFGPKIVHFPLISIGRGGTPLWGGSRGVELGYFYPKIVDFS